MPGHRVNAFASSPTVEIRRKESSVTGSVNTAALTLVARTRSTAWTSAQQRLPPGISLQSRLSSHLQSRGANRINPKVAEKESSSPISAPA